MRVVAALGRQRAAAAGQELSAENQRENARAACKALAPVALEHELVISHGNGPQVGLLALQGSAYTAVDAYPLDVLGAQTEGMIGYIIQQELGNELPFERHLATLLTMIEVDAARPRVRRPDEADRAALRRGRGASGSQAEKGWTFKPDGDSLPPRRPLAAAEADLRDRGDQGAARAGLRRHLRGRRRHPDDLHRRAGARRAAARRRRGRDRQGPRERAARDRPRRGRARRSSPTSTPSTTGWGTPEQRAIRRATPESLAASEFAGRLDGPEGARRVPVRRAHREGGRDRLDRGRGGARPRRGGHPRDARRRGPRARRGRLSGR